VDREHDLGASLSVVETRQVTNDSTIRFDSKLYQIARSDIRTGLRGANVRIESHLDGSLKVRFQQHYLAVSQCMAQPKQNIDSAPAVRKPSPARSASPALKQAHHQFLATPAALPLWKAAQIDRTRTSDKLEE